MILSSFYTLHQPFTYFHSDSEYARRESRFGSSRPPGRPAERNTPSRGQDRVEDRPSVQTRPEVEVKSSINKSSDVRYIYPW